jgi:hypothetical protein
MRTETAGKKASVRSVGPVYTLDDLAAKSYDELESLYAGGVIPKSMKAVDGPLKGRMLAVRHIRGGVASAIATFAGSSSFIWDGKTFKATDDGNGGGINRIRIPGVLGSQDLFPFYTRFQASVVDGRPTLVLDYDRHENPLYIRKIHDEIREISPGMYLGPAMWKRASSPTTLLWFALDTGAAHRS